MFSIQYADHGYSIISVYLKNAREACNLIYQTHVHAPLASAHGLACICQYVQMRETPVWLVTLHSRLHVIRSKLHVTLHCYIYKISWVNIYIYMITMTVIYIYMFANLGKSLSEIHGYSISSFTPFPWSRYHRSQLLMMTVARSKRRH